MNRSNNPKTDEKFQLSLTKRFAGIQLFLALFIVLSISGLSYGVMLTLLEDTYQRQLNESTSAVSSITHNFIDSHGRQLDQLLDERVFEKYTRSFSDIALRGHFSRFDPYFEQIIYADKEGREIIIHDRTGGTYRPEDLSACPLFNRAKARPNQFHLSDALDTLDTPPAIWLGQYMINYFGDPLGYVCVRIPVTTLNRTLAQFATPKDVRTIITYPSGEILYDSQEKWVGQGVGKDYFSKGDTGANNPTLTGRRSFLTYPDCIVSAAIMPDYGWQVFNIIPYEDYIKPLKTFRNKTLATIVIVSILAVGIIVIFVTYLIKPIRLLTQTAHEIAYSGDLDRQVQWNSKDDIGDLANSFNLMLKRLKTARNELIQERGKTENIIASMADTVIVADENNKIVKANHALYGLLGYKEKEILGLNVLDLMAPGQESLKKAIAETLSKERIYKSIDSVLIGKEQQRVFVTVSGALLTDSGGRAAGKVFVAKDISKLKEAQIRLSHQANHDSLTGLPNRLALTENLKNILEQIKRHNRLAAVLFIDIDRFKLVNDTLGHSAGDQLIQEVGRRLRRNIRDDDIVARLGGDEFIVVLNDVARMEDIETIAQKILTTFQKTINLNGHAYTATASIGISTAPDQGNDPETLMKNADMAMYQAKRKGRNTYQVYSPDMHVDTRSIFHMEVAMRKALEKNEFRVYFQPVVDVRTRQIVSVEALVRWKKEDGGLYSPLEFLPIAEETGLILPLGQWILQQAFEQVRQWHQKGFPHIGLAVNISDRQFRAPDLPGVIRDILNQTGFPAEKLNLELTEGILMQDIDQANQTLARLQDLGATISVDDFGTGYSSLAHLKRFSLDVLKIDRSFVSGLPDSGHDRALVKAIIGLAHTLGLKIIAEGVETEAQAEFLKQKGADMLQGFLFAQALPADELYQLLCSYQTVAVSAG